METEHNQSEFTVATAVLHRNWTQDEQRLIAHSKRCIECFRGDSAFRAVITNGSTDEKQQTARSRGIEIDPDDLSNFLNERFGCHGCTDKTDLSSLERLWLDWTELRLEQIHVYRNKVHEMMESSRYQAWHKRQVSRCEWELGPQNRYVSHTALVFELSKGCSVGCWFCGFNAEKLQKVFRRTVENRQLWIDTLNAAKKVLGSVAAAGFCYWATEPFDNPDYLDFLKDYQQELGLFPPTTTAVPLRQLRRTRELLDYCRTSPVMKCRFSVTSLEMLHRIHAEFTAEELLHVELVLQNPESITPFHSSGKFRDVNGPTQPPTNQMAGHYDTGTISCVSGFLVNMVEREIRLISPCHASDRWPLGYRVFWKTSFDGSESFAAALQQAVEQHMPTSLKGPQALQFNENLKYEELTDGFKLESLFRTYTATGSPVLKTLGELIARGDMTVSETITQAVNQGHDYLAVAGAVQHLFDKGLLEET